MTWLQSLDTGLFRFVNTNLANPVFDWLMPFVSGNAFFYPLVLVAAVILICKGGARGRIFVLVLAITIAVSDSFVCNNIKKAVGRPRPFLTLPDVRRPGTSFADIADSTRSRPDAAAPIQKASGGSASMPSSHAANWFAATLVAFAYFRRSIRFMLPMAILVSVSRVYNGVHYPSDVLAGALLGAGSAAACLWSLNAIWMWAGSKWFPLWWGKLPSLLNLKRPGHASYGPRGLDEQQTEQEELTPLDADGPGSAPPHANLDQHWLRVGYLLIAVLLLARLSYIASGVLELTGDEVYQWLWSKHLALSYYSKPPLIAYAQFIGTTICGDTELGVRFLSPVSSAILSLVLLRFFVREVNARAGFFLILIAAATPLAAAGAILMTVDPLSVLFWAAAMVAGWRAVQADAKTSSWLWVGLWMGLGFLSKYTELLQWLSWAVFFALWPPARNQLRKPGPYFALFVNILCAVPVLVWNWQHQWATVSHVLTANAKVGEPWKPTLKYLLEFIGGEAGVLNPVFFVGMVWASIALWKRGRHNPRLVYFFSMGAPLFVVYLLFTLHSRVQLNWIAPSITPLLCLMVAYWDTQWRLGNEKVKFALIAGVGLGLPVVVLAHNMDLLSKVTGYSLPARLNPLHRANGWKEVARLTGEARNSLLTEGKPVFVITSHYRFTGEIAFYLSDVRNGDEQGPLVYYITSPTPDNQFYFWPGYKDRKGENAIFVQELYRDNPVPQAPPAVLLDEFESVTDLGIRTVLYHGELVWPVQFFACRRLK